MQPVTLELKSANGDGRGKDNEKEGGAVAKGGKPDKAATAETPAKRREPKAVAQPKGKVKLKRAQVVLFTEELSDLLGAGLQLEPALHIMESRDELSNLKVVTTMLRQQVRDGASFSSSLRNASNSFGELYCNLAAAGEVSGALPVILKRQAVYLMKLQELQSKVVAAMIYPACLFTAVVAVSLLFVSFLMPQLVGLLDSMGREMPFMAKVLLSATGLLKTYWWAILALIIAAVVIFRKVTSTPPYEAALAGVQT